MSNHAQNLSIGISHDTPITPVEYQGQRVLTLAMIDKVHCRPEDTASRNFKVNRKRFVQGEDYYLVDYSQKDDFRPFGITIPPRGLIVLTESGYLLLVKSFTDDLSWTIQKQLIQVYFRVKEAVAPQPQPAPTPESRAYAQERITTAQYYDLKHLVGLIEMNFHAAGSANYYAWGTLRQSHGIEGDIKQLPADRYPEAVEQLKAMGRLSGQFKVAVMELERRFFKAHFNANQLPDPSTLGGLLN